MVSSSAFLEGQSTHRDVPGGLSVEIGVLYSRLPLPASFRHGAPPLSTRFGALRIE